MEAVSAIFGLHPLALVVLCVVGGSGIFVWHHWYSPKRSKERQLHQKQKDEKRSIERQQQDEKRGKACRERARLAAIRRQEENHAATKEKKRKKLGSKIIHMPESKGKSAQGFNLPQELEQEYAFVANSQATLWPEQQHVYVANSQTSPAPTTWQEQAYGDFDVYQSSTGRLHTT